MQWLAQICVRRPVLACVLMLIIVVFGLAGYSRLGLDQFPDVDLPVIVVTAHLDGAAPEEVETDITDRLEAAINTISGVDTLHSASTQGVAQHSNKSIRDTSEIADKVVRRQIESIWGVGQVTVVGARNRQINVWLDPIALRSHRLTAVDVQRAIVAQNLTTPGGNIETGPENLTLRIVGKVASPAALGRVVVSEQDGHAIHLDDVARVQDGQAEEKTFAQVNRYQTVMLTVVKQSGQNTVTVVDAVKARIKTIQNTLPHGTTLEVVRDNSQVIRTGIHAVKEHLVVGAILAALVVLLFLANLRSTIIAAITIPISIIGTFAVMWLAGFTLNFLTLLALALAVGIVIDDAIVVLENIVRHIEDKGMKPFVAAVMATRDIGLAVLATTLSLMAVFIPVSFMSGVAGRFLRSFGLTMAFAIGVSLLVSFTLTPTLAARWLAGQSSSMRKPTVLDRAVDASYLPLERTYVNVLAWVLRHRWVMVLACVAALASCIPLAKALPSSFLPEDDTAQFDVSMRAPEGTSITSTRLNAERVADDIRRLRGVTRTLTTVGGGDLEATNVAKIYVILTEPKKRAEGQFVIMERVRKEILAKLPPTLSVTAGEIPAFAVGASSTQHVQLAIRGPDLDALGVYARRITEKLRKTPGAVDVDNSLVEGKPELRIGIQRERAAALGVQVADIAGTLQLLIGGLKVSSYGEGGEEYDIRVRADAHYRADPSTLALIEVPSQKFGAIPLASVVEAKAESGPAQINRLGRRRQITIMANSAPGVGDSTVRAALEKIIAAEHFPPGYTVEPVGQSKDAAETGTGFIMVIGLAFVFMYLILAAQFESWLHPVTILLSLPLTVPFALLSLLIFHESLNLFSALGLLVLFGVVKKNAILQIDHTNNLRKRGRPRFEAILEANKDRLRPILMTTLAFIAGMIPLVNSHGIGSGQNHTMGAIVLGGQSLSLLLTLLAVPVAYSFFDDVAVWFRRTFASNNKADKGEQELDALLGDEAANNTGTAGVALAIDLASKKGSQA